MEAGCRFTHLIRDRDAKFTAASDAVFTSTGMAILPAAPQAPRMNAIAERSISSARSERPDQMLITGERHLRLVLREYAEHYDTHRPHRTPGQRPPAGPECPPRMSPDIPILPRDQLNGLIHEYPQVT